MLALCSGGHNGGSPLPGKWGRFRRVTEPSPETQLHVQHVGWLRHAPGDELATLLRQGCFEPHEQAFAWLYLRPGDSFLDCGAHVGLYSVLAGRATEGRGRIVSVEANAGTAALLRANLEANGLPTADVLVEAIWSAPGTIRFDAEGEGRAAYGHVDFERGARGVEVAATTVDAIVARTGAERFALVKLDLEGAEPEAIAGAAGSLASGACPLLMVEFTEANLQRRGWDTARLAAALRALGLGLYGFSADRLELVPFDASGPIWFANLFATRDAGPINERLRTAPDARRAIARDVLGRARACDRLRELEDLERFRREAADHRAWAERTEALLAQARERTEANRAWAEKTEASLAAAAERAGRCQAWAEQAEASLAEARARSDANRAWAEKTEGSLAEARERADANRAWAEKAEASLAETRDRSDANRAWAEKAEERAAANQGWAERTEATLAAERTTSAERLAWAERTEAMLAKEREERRVLAESPRISVVTASYNAAATIERTLQSIEAQRYPNLELICVDGASTDGTAEIVRRYGHLVRRFVCEPDRGVGDALNKGFRLATGEILCWLNADDELAPGALQRVADFFRAHPDVDVVTGACERVFANGVRFQTQVPDRYLDTMALRNDIEQPSTFWRAAVHRRAGELDESYRLAFDWEFWNRLLRQGARFARVTDLLSVYHFSETNLTSRGGQRVVDEMSRITATYASPGTARVYQLIYRLFDLRGFYDRPFHELSPGRRAVLGRALGLLRRLYGARVVDNYNWNWASKQARGLVWYL
jgi:FkbM family methyltransferase